jgi:hypothetical protein
MQIPWISGSLLDAIQHSDNAKKLVADNTGFNQEALQATVERILKASNLNLAGGL